MGLTKPRASQIYDIDYKQATRVITTTNINLNGGAPSQVDGVNLSIDDRVLVIGQNTGSQNGIYFVDTVGTGSNGTWARSTDTNSTGELLAGTIVMVTEGLIYHDTQWKLTTNNPIVIGTTPLTFEQNSAFAFGNIYANNTAVLATSVGDVLTLTAGNNISISGNNASKTVSIGVTGISLNSISNGTSNVSVVSPDGNVTVGIAGTSNVAVFSATGANITGTLNATGNANVGNLGATTVVATTLTGTLSTVAQTNITSVGTLGSLTVTANVAGGNITTAGQVVATGNITGDNLNTAGQVVATGNITGGNLSIVNNVTISGNLSVTGNATLSGNILGDRIQNGTTSIDIQTPSGNANISIGGISNVAVFSTTGANVTGTLEVTGNITGGNILGNGYNLTGINSFSTISVTGGNTITADSIADTLTLTAGSGIVIIANTVTDTLTISTGGSGVSIFATGGDMELITDLITDSLDLGLITESVTENNDLGGFFIEGFVGNDNFLPNSIYGNVLLANAVIATTGNITAGYFIGNGSALTGVVAGAPNAVVNGTTNISTATNGNANITIGGTSNVAVFSTTGVAVSGSTVVTYAPASATGVTITASGANTQGGTGYADFLRATNASGGATNPNKTFRLNSAGGIEIINSAYSATLLTLTDAGALSIGSTMSSTGFYVNNKQAVNGPAFRAYIAVSQTITSGSQQKVTFGSETFDTNSNFGSSRFTPTVEGYYQLNATVRISGSSGTGEVMITIWKNGSEYARGTNEGGTEQGANWYSMQVSDLAYANGTGDYFEIYVQQSSGGNRDTTAGQNISYFSGAMVRGA
jgi:hypothetical protein